MGALLNMKDFSPRKSLKLTISYKDPVWGVHSMLTIDECMAAFREKFGMKIKCCFNADDNAMEEFFPGVTWQDKLKVDITITFKAEEIVLELKGR